MTFPYSCNYDDPELLEGDPELSEGLLAEAAAVYKVTPTRIFAYKWRKTDPTKVQTVQIRHHEVHKHYKELIDPPEGYKVIGYIGPGYGKPEDVETSHGELEIEPDSEAVTSKGEKGDHSPGDKVKTKTAKAKEGEPTKKGPEPEPEKEPVKSEPEKEPEPSKAKEEPKETEPEKKTSDHEKDLAVIFSKLQAIRAKDISPSASDKAQKSGWGATGNIAALLTYWEQHPDLTLSSSDIRSLMTTMSDFDPEDDFYNGAAESLQHKGIIEGDPEGWSLAKAPEKDPLQGIEIDPTSARMADSIGLSPEGEVAKFLSILKKEELTLPQIHGIFKKLGWNLSNINAILSGLKEEGYVFEVDGTFHYSTNPDVDEDVWKEAGLMSDNLKKQRAYAVIFQSVKDQKSSGTFTDDLQNLIAQKLNHSHVVAGKIIDDMELNSHITKSGDYYYWPGQEPKPEPKKPSEVAKEIANALDYGNEDLAIAIDGIKTAAENDSGNIWFHTIQNELASAGVQTDPDIIIGNLLDDGYLKYLGSSKNAFVFHYPAEKPGFDETKLPHVSKEELGGFAPEDFVLGLDSTWLDQASNGSWDVGTKIAKAVRKQLAAKYGEEDVEVKFNDFAKKYFAAHPDSEDFKNDWTVWLKTRFQALDAGSEWYRKIPVVDAALKSLEGEEVAKPVTPIQQPSKITAFEGKDIGEFSAEDAALISNLMHVRKHFKSQYGLTFANKKINSILTYMGLKYGEDWKDQWEKVDADLSDKHSKHHYYVIKHKALDQLKAEYGDKWMEDHPTLKDAYQGKPPGPKPEPEKEPEVKEPIPGVSAPIELDSFYPQKLLYGMTPESMFIGNWEGPIKQNLADEFGVETTNKIFSEWAKQYYDNGGFWHSIAAIKADNGTESVMDQQAPILIKKKYGKNWASSLPTISAIISNMKIKEAEGTSQTQKESPLPPGGPSKITAFTQADTGIFHPEDYVIMDQLPLLVQTWKEKFGSIKSHAMRGKVEAYFAKKYGDDWSANFYGQDDYLNSKYGTNTLADKFGQANSELFSAYGKNGEDWSFTHPTIQAAMPELLGKELPGPAAADFLPGKPSKITAVTNTDVPGMHPEDLGLLMLRHYHNSDKTYQELISYMKEKYGKDILTKVIDFEDGLLNSSKKTATYDKLKEQFKIAYGSQWYTQHPVMKAILSGEAPPISGGWENPGKKQPDPNKMLPGAPTVSTSFSKFDLGEFYPDDFVVLNKMIDLMDDLSDDKYHKVIDYFKAKYGDTVFIKRDDLIIKFKNAGTPYHQLGELAAHGAEQIKNAYPGGAHWWSNYPPIKAALTGQVPKKATPMGPGGTTYQPSEPPKKATPSSFNPFLPGETGEFAPSDYALLGNLPTVWQKLKSKYGEEKGASTFVKLMHALHDKYGAHMKDHFEALKKQNASNPSATKWDKVTADLKDAYGVDWVEGHPTILAAQQAPEPTGLPASVIKDAELAAKSGEISSSFKKFNIPDVTKDFKFKKDAKFLGGVHSKKIYEDADGKEWLYKPAMHSVTGQEKAFAAAGAEAFSKVATSIMPHHVPIKRVAIESQVGTIQPMLDTASQATLEHVDPEHLSPSEKIDVASEHILDWLFSQHDSHGANLLRLKSGHIVGVDKDQSFKYMDVDKLDVNYNPSTDTYYNRFWRDWSEGRFDFDPTTLAETIHKVDDFSNEEFEKILKPYADTFYKGHPQDQAVFTQKAVVRKNTIKRNFEKFITTLYKKKTGKDGKFTFAGGFDTGAPKTKKETYSSSQVASQYGGKVSNFATKSGETDPNKVTIKVPKSSGKQKLEQILDELQLPKTAIIEGGQNFLVSVSKADFDAAKVTKEIVEEKIDHIPTTPSKPAYKPAASPPPSAKPNASEIKKVGSDPLGYTGKHYHIGGAAVEGQVVKAKKFIDGDGNPYFQFTFKLRKQFHPDLKNGTYSTLRFYQADYDPSKDEFKQVDGSSANYTTNSRLWKKDNSDVQFVLPESNNSAFHGTVVARVRPNPGQSPEEALQGVLEEMKPGLAKEVMRDPSPEEVAVIKLAKLLWDKDPKKALALKDSDYTVDKLKAALEEKGVTFEEINKIETKEAIPGHVTHMIKGRWKTLAKTKDGSPALRFFIHATKTADGLANILKYGILSIYERNIAGAENNSFDFEDISTGGADSVYTRAAMASSANKSVQVGNVSGPYQLLIAPDEADRLDAYGYTTDSFGACSDKGSYSDKWGNRKSLEATLTDLNKEYKENNEVMFRKGVSVNRILRVVANNEGTRTAVIKSLKDQGINEVNDVPIEDFVVVCLSQGEAYDKYVKPLGY